jgi:acyl-CoA dehydrogenase
MSDTARMLDDTAERLLARRLSGPFARGDPMTRTTLLAEIAEAGLPLVLAPEDQGGLGGGLEEATAVAWRMGWHAAPLPVAALLLLPTLPGSEAWPTGRVTLAHAPGLGVNPVDNLMGPPIEAPEIGETDTVLVVCAGRGGPVVVMVDTAGAQRFHALDHEPWLRIDPQGAKICAVHPFPFGPKLGIQGALITAAAMMGAMARELDIAIDHANTRKQFGKPLGKFQAVQHMIAGAASEYAVAQAALAGAVAAEDGGWGRSLLWRSAKAQAGRAATIVTSTAHQVLGAIGFTEEHVLHRYSKRLWVWRDDWGRQSALELSIGQEVCADPRGLWSYIADDAA